MATASLRSEPDLVIIGVKRGGTTSIFRALERHPSMCPLVPSARWLPLRENQKGVHYFDAPAHRSARWYRSHFPTALTTAWRRRRTGHAFTAEASPYYFFHPLAAGRAAAMLHHTHFVVVLRDPVERTISHWAEQARDGAEHLTFTEAIAAEAGRVGDDAARLASGELEASTAHQHQSYVAQSRYADALERWWEAVGRERLTVLYSEEFFADPARTLGRITDALGVSPVPDRGHHVYNAAPRPPLDASTERDLVDRFRDDVGRLGSLLGVQPPWSRFWAVAEEGRT